MTFAPFWAGGLALAAVAIGHFLITGTHFGVSGRISALVDRMRSALRRNEPAPPTRDELVEALRAMTLEEFGREAIDDAPCVARAPSGSGASRHVLFFVGLALGGAAAALARGASIVPTLAGEAFASTFGSGPSSVAALFAGGLLVGFGTRMAGGCTSGHGLVGVSAGRPASLLATACFFGSGVAVSVLLEALR